jgi:hypothetical protein
MRKSYLVILAALVLLMFVSCFQLTGTDLPFVLPQATKKGVGGYQLKALCYVDVSLYNPLNAGDYTLAIQGTPLFDYVVLGAAQIRKDSQGVVYLYYPESLLHILENRKTYIIPLQQKGIRVVLGLTGGGDGVSFGSLSRDDIAVFNHAIKDGLEEYGLNGVEFYDAGAAESSNPETFPYPEGYVWEDGQWKYVDRYPGDDNAKLAGWEGGGDVMNNTIYLLRNILLDTLNQPIIVREENYGCYLPVEVSMANFTSRDDQLNFLVNPRFDTFGNEDEGEGANEYVQHSLYAPLAINLGGDDTTGTVVPPIEDTSGQDKDIGTFSGRFAMIDESGKAKCNYGLIYFQNIKPVSQAAAENYLKVPSTGQNMTQAEYISITSRAAFGEDVICSGGDHLKTW